MKKILLITATITALAAGSVFAQVPASDSAPGEGQELGQGQGQGKGKGGDPEVRMQRMKQHLNLSDEQVAEIRQIREDGGKREDIRAVLTEEQQATWDQRRAQHREAKMKQQPQEQPESTE